MPPKADVNGYGVGCPLLTHNRQLGIPKPDMGMPKTAVLGALKLAEGSWNRHETVGMRTTRIFGAIQILVCIHFPMADMGLFFDQEIIVEVEIV